MSAIRRRAWNHIGICPHRRRSMRREEVLVTDLEWQSSVMHYCGTKLPVKFEKQTRLTGVAKVRILTQSRPDCANSNWPKPVTQEVWSFPNNNDQGARLDNYPKLFRRSPTGEIQYETNRQETARRFPSQFSVSHANSHPTSFPSMRR